jgi:hypothetical protein
VRGSHIFCGNLKTDGRAMQFLGARTGDELCSRWRTKRGLTRTIRTTGVSLKVAVGDLNGTEDDAFGSYT